MFIFLNGEMLEQVQMLKSSFCRDSTRKEEEKVGSETCLTLAIWTLAKSVTVLDLVEFAL